jgi:hypothetical protein
VLGLVDGEQVVGVRQADHGHAVLGHRVVDGVPAYDRAAGGVGDVQTAAQHLAQQLDGQVFTGPGGEVHRDERLAAHGVDVRQRVGGGDATPVVGIVHDGREEVGGQHDGPLVVQAQHRRVVALGGADE